MYARDLMIWLHERLDEPGAFDQTLKRFEALRGYNLIPRGRENAGTRLSNEQIASAVLGFAHRHPAYAGHAALVLGNLCPVGGEGASFLHTDSLRNTVAALIADEKVASGIARLTLSIARDFGDEEYGATLRGLRGRSISYVSKYSISLLDPSVNKEFDHDHMNKLSAMERSFSPIFFESLARHVALSRQLNLPLKTDWREYATEEERASFHKKLGAKNSSHFLNLRVDAQVAWPKEPTRVQFGGHYFVLFPRTKEHSHSVSIDLTHERISAEDARTLINRMLSVMSWCDDRPSSLHEGWSGNPVPVAVSRRDLAFFTMSEWYFSRSLPADITLMQCLAYYRDGLNAESVGLGSHAVLSFFRVFETQYDKKRRVINWVNEIFEGVRETIRENALKEFESDRLLAGVDVGTYIYENCRVATAHAARDLPSDPDGAEELRRLLNASEVIRRIARFFIEQKYHFSTKYFSD